MNYEVFEITENNELKVKVADFAKGTLAIDFIDYQSTLGKLYCLVCDGHIVYSALE